MLTIVYMDLEICNH